MPIKAANQQSQPEENRLRLSQLVDGLLIVCFSAALSLPITIPWVVLTVGLIAWCLSVRLVPLNLWRFWTEPPLALPVAIFLLSNILSAVINKNGSEIVPVIMMMRALLVYFWGFQIFKRTDRLKVVAVHSMLLAGAISGVVGMFEQLLHLHVGSYEYLQGTGFLTGPMAFAGQMQLFSLLAIGLLITDTFKKTSGFLATTIGISIVTVCTVLGVLFASERSAWLGFLSAIVVISAVVSPRILIKSVLVASIAACLAWFTVPVVQTRMTSIFDPMHDISSRARLTVWKTAILLFETGRDPGSQAEAPHDADNSAQGDEKSELSMKSIIFGIGPRNFPHIKLDENMVPGKKVKAYLDHAHSNYLQALCTTGLIGLCAYLYLLAASLRLTWQNYVFSDGFSRGTNLGILGGLVALMVAGIFEYNFGTGQVRLTQWYLLAFLAQAKAASYQAK